MLRTLLALGLWCAGLAGCGLAYGWARVLAVPPPLFPGALSLLLLVAGGVLLVRQGWVTAALLTVPLVGAPCILYPNFIMARPMGQLTACRSNLKNLGVALEMYASDNQGLYPKTLAQLTPGNYLKTIPQCGGEDEDEPRLDSYSSGYEPGKSGFKLCCKGLRHPRLLGRPDSPHIDEQGKVSD